MSFPSTDLVSLREQLPAVDSVTALRNKIHQTLSPLEELPKHWITFDVYRIPEEHLALIQGELVIQGWQVRIKKQFSFLRWYSGFPMPTYLQIRGY